MHAQPNEKCFGGNNDSFVEPIQSFMQPSIDYLNSFFFCIMLLLIDGTLGIRTQRC